MRILKLFIILIWPIFLPAATSNSQPLPGQRPPPVSKKNMPPPRHGRESISLDGDWKYLTSSIDGGTAEGWTNKTPASAKETAIPGFVNKFELPKLAGSVWLWHEFVLPARWKGQTVRLRFGAVSLHSTVWLDGEKIGEHEGSYLPFEWNVTSHAAPGKNQLITVKIQGSTDHGVGIWQHVDMVAHDEAYLADCFPQGGSTGDITAKVQIYNSSNNSGLVFAELLIPSAENIFTRAGRKTHRTAQGQDAGLGHHMFAFLIFVDSVCRMIFAFEQYVRHRQLGRVRCRGKTRWARPNNGNLETF